jgi:hypothetical protein
MPTKKNLPGLTDFQDKFLLFQECVEAWICELARDLHALETSEGKTLQLENVISFPGNGSGRRQPKLSPEKGA